MARWIAVLLLPAFLLLGTACEEEGTEPTTTPTVAGAVTETAEPQAPTKTPPPPPPAATQPPVQQEQPPPEGLELRVSAFDDTTDRPADDLEVWLRGFGSWYPDLSFGSDVVAYEMLFMARLPNMVIYPDGRDGGTEIPVEFEIPGDFIPGSDRDMVQIGISDTTVTVFGTVIPGLEMEFAR